MADFRSDRRRGRGRHRDAKPRTDKSSNATPYVDIFKGWFAEPKSAKTRLGGSRVRTSTVSPAATINQVGDRRNPDAIPPWLLRAALSFGIVFAAVLVVGVLFALAATQGLPDPHLLERMNGGGGVVYRYRDQTTTLATDGRRPGPMVDMTTLPSYVPNAFIAVEDKRFASNGGIDLTGLARAFVVNAKAGRSREGGSTITQQLVRRVLLRDNTKTLTRKIQEILLSIQVSRIFPKQKIMQMYLTSLDYNRQAVGIDDGARVYFGKAAKDLTLTEAAMLAGMVKGPSEYDPYLYPEKAWNRAKIVLGKMYEQGLLGGGAKGQATYDAAIANPPSTRPAEDVSWRFAFRKVRYEHDQNGLYLPQLSEKLGATLYVNLSLDAGAQALADKVVRTRLAAYPQLQAVLVAADGDGAVRALIGARNFVGTDGYSSERRQLGSVYKSFIYGAAMEAGASPDDLCDDLPGLSWDVKNHDGAYRGPISLETAFAYSSNVVATRLGHEVGYGSVIDLARRAGLTTPPPNVQSWPLVAEATPLELTEAILPFSNGGHAARLRFHDAILYGRNQRADEQPPPASASTIFTPRTLAAMDRLARAVVTETGATGERANVPGKWIGGKTGTTNENRDIWFAAFGRGWVVVVWVGRVDNGPLPADLSGSSLPAEIVGDFMRGETLGWGDPPAEADASLAAPLTPSKYFSGPANPESGEGCVALRPRSATGDGSGRWYHVQDGRNRG